MMRFLLFVIPFIFTFGLVEGEGVFQKIKHYERTLNREYPIFLKTGKTDVFLNQNLKVRNCIVEIRAYHQDFGFLYGDEYDLTFLYPLRAIQKVNGAYGIVFGAKSHFRKRSRLYFNSKKYRLSVWKTLKRLSLLCKKRSVKKRFGKAIEDYFRNEQRKMSLHSPHNACV